MYDEKYWNFGLLSRRTVLASAVAGALSVVLGAGARNAFASTSAPEKNSALIVFFSRSGNTRRMAGMIRDFTGGRLVELKTAVPYPEEYRATTEQAKRELESDFRPKLATQAGDISSHDVVFIGSPSWWGTMAPPVRTFLTENDFSGKTLVPFITHEGSGLGKSVGDLGRLCPNSTIARGLAVRGGSVDSAGKEIEQWLRDLKMIG